MTQWWRWFRCRREAVQTSSWTEQLWTESLQWSARSHHPSAVVEVAVDEEAVVVDSVSLAAPSVVTVDDTVVAVVSLSSRSGSNVVVDGAVVDGISAVVGSLASSNAVVEVAVDEEAVAVDSVSLAAPSVVSVDDTVVAVVSLSSRSGSNVVVDGAVVDGISAVVGSLASSNAVVEVAVDEKAVAVDSVSLAAPSVVSVDDTVVAVVSLSSRSASDVRREGSCCGWIRRSGRLARIIQCGRRGCSGRRGRRCRFGLLWPLLVWSLSMTQWWRWFRCRREAVQTSSWTEQLWTESLQWSARSHHPMRSSRLQWTRKPSLSIQSPWPLLLWSLSMTQWWRWFRCRREALRMSS
ncbi:hypothetical protein OSTOST_10861 [Ostertagia ostertagi]